MGIVDALGPGSTAQPTGTRVACLLYTVGGNAEYVIVAADRLVPVPDDVSAVDAAAAATNGFVALQMLTRVARVRSGQQILVHGASGGVGSALVQRRPAGGHVYGTASPAKHPLVADLGATAGLPVA